MNDPDLFLIKVTAREALVLRLALAAARPHLTPHELADSHGLEARLAQATP